MTDFPFLPVDALDGQVREVYDALKDLVQADDLPPFAAANLKDALASVSVVVTGLTLDYENLIDLGV